MASTVDRRAFLRRALMARMGEVQVEIGLENVPKEFDKYIDNSIAEKSMAG